MELQNNNPQLVRPLSDGERRAQRTLAAAQRLLHPDEPQAEAISSVEAELAGYVKNAYARRAYG